MTGTTAVANLNADLVDGRHYDSDWNAWNDADPSWAEPLQAVRSTR